MIPLIIEIIEYDKSSNTCIAELQTGETVNFDPFVSCSLVMDELKYFEGFGFSYVGKKYLMTEYSVYLDCVVPHEDGLKLID